MIQFALRIEPFPICKIAGKPTKEVSLGLFSELCYKIRELLGKKWLAKQTFVA